MFPSVTEEASYLPLAPDPSMVEGCEVGFALEAEKGGAEALKVRVIEGGRGRGM